MRHYIGSIKHQLCVEVLRDTVTVLSDTSLRAADLDEAAALKAKKHAEKLLPGQPSHVDVARARAELFGECI